MGNRSPHLLFFLLCFFLSAVSFASASDLSREDRILRTLQKADCAHRGISWDDVCQVRPYHSRDAAVADALNRAESTSSSESQPAHETQRVTSIPVVPPPRVPVTRQSEPEKVWSSDDRTAAVDEALNSYQEFQKRQNILHAGVEIFTYEYEEQMFMKEDGTMYGVFADYRYRFKQNQPMTSLMEIMDINDRGLNVLMLDARFSAMTDGHYKADGVALESFDNTYFSHELRMMGGYELPIIEKRLIVMPYAGFGFRYLLDDGGGHATPVGEVTYVSYDRESYYFYIPLGIEARKFYNRGWSTKLTAEYDWLISGRQKSHIPIELGGTAENFQPSGYGIRGSFRLAKEIEAMEFFVEPFARYWHIADSNVNDGGIEPRNITQEYGAKIGIRF